MNKRIILSLLLVTFVCLEASAQNRRYRRRGVILGGLAGAALGIAIGDKGDNETAGALIGGAVGAIAGGTIGNQKDQLIEQNQRYHPGYPYHGRPSHGHIPHAAPQYVDPVYGQPSRAMPAYDQPYVYPQHSQFASPEPESIEEIPVDHSRPVVIESKPISGAVAIEDVLTMTRSGMSAGLIIRQIELHGVERQLAVSEVIEMHKVGVDEQVIEAMQAAASPSVAPSAPPEPGQSYNLPPFTGEVTPLPPSANSPRNE